MVMHNCRIAVEGNGFTNALQLNALLVVHNYPITVQITVHYYPSAICSVVSSADHSASQLSARLVQQQWANRSTCKTASPRSKCQRQVFDCFHNLCNIFRMSDKLIVTLSNWCMSNSVACCNVLAKGFILVFLPFCLFVFFSFFLFVSLSFEYNY